MDLLSTLMILLPRVWPLLLIGLFQHITPDLTRPDLFFGVTVDRKFRDSQPAHDIRHRYSVAIWTATLVALVLAIMAAFVAIGVLKPPALLASLAALVTRTGLGHMPLLPLVLQLIVQLWAYIRANRATRPHATQRASVIEVDLSTKPHATSAILITLVLPIASLFVMAAWAGLYWHDLPSRIATHWSFAGPDHWVAATPTTIITLLFLNAFVCSLLALVAWGVLNGSRRISTSGEAAERERRFRRRVVLLVVVVEYLAVFPAWATLLELPQTAMKLWMLFFPATILVLLARLILVGQGGTRGLARSASPSSRPDTAVGDRTDDRYWKWGLFYFNRTDPAFLVEKRFGVGYTFNFAHPFAWTLVVLIAAIPLVHRLL